MSFGRTKLLLFFSFMGFLLGSTGYYIFNWIAVNSKPEILYIPIPVFAPWFLSGIAGSFLSIIAISIAARFSESK